MTIAACAGMQRGQQHARRGGTRGLLQRRADRPLEPVRREQLLGRQDARQDRAVRREEEPRTRPEHERDDRELRDADRRRSADDDDGDDRDEVR